MFGSKFYFSLATCCVALLTQCGFVSPLISTDLSSSQVYVDDHGRYQNLVISINLKMSQIIDESAYLDDVQVNIRRLSKAVYNGTGLQFGNVTILVPSHWKDSSYTQAFAQAPETADILIQPLEDRELYTQHIQGCGRQALFMAVDAKYIKANVNNEGKVKKQFFHEWMHSRYGVFDEHPLTQGSSHGPDPTAIDQQNFYHSSHSTLEGVRCGLDLNTETECRMTEVTGYKDIDARIFLPKKSCTFTVLSPSIPSTSIMSNYELENVELLCDEQTHNDEAPNRQNRLCSGRSIMEVTRTHPDFVKLEEVKKMSSMATYSDPTFSVEHLQKSRTIVIVLDTSTSMKGPRLFLATQAIGSMIEHIIEDYASILIVEFYETANKLYPKDSDQPVELDSKERRLEVVSSLTNISTGGYTCIGCGLKLGYDLVKAAQGGTASGAFFVLLTDGVDNKNSKFAEIFEKSQQEAFFIDTILLADQTDRRLEDLARGAGSSVFSATDDPSALVDAFTEMITNRQNLSNQVVQIYSQMQRVKPQQNISGQFMVESHLVELAEIVFYWNVTAQPFLSFSLTRENDGKVLLTKTNASTSMLGYLKVPLHGSGDNVKEETLSFKYFIANAHASVQLVSTVTVNSHTTQSGDDERRKRRSIAEDEFDQAYGMRSFINGESNFTFSDAQPAPTVSIHAFLPAGSTPQLSKSVVATVTVAGLNSNQSDVFQVELRDLGTGADIIGGDNIYSAYFTNYVSYNATYYVRIRATGAGFMRYSSTGSFAVYMQPDINVAAYLPPADILDLQLVETEMNQVTVSFTSTGADLDSGNATYYRAWCANVSADLRQYRNRSLLENATLFLVTPKMAYSPESFIVNIPKEFSTKNETVWIGLTAVDEYGLESDMSNLVSSRYMPEVVDAFAFVDVDSTDTECELDTIIVCLRDLYFYIIIGVASILLLLIFIIIIICCCRRRKKRSKDDQKGLHNVDSPTNSSISVVGSANYYGDIDMMNSDMADHDEIQMADEHINTFRRQPLPSTKTRVQSLNWSKSLKRLSRKTPKQPAPIPPTKPGQPQTHSVIANDMQRKKNKQNSQLTTVWVSSKTSKTVLDKPTVKSASSGLQHLHSERAAPKPQHVDTTTMENDIKTAEGYCSGFIQANSQTSAPEHTDVNL